MDVKTLLSRIGIFSEEDVALFRQLTERRPLRKNELLWRKGDMCQQIYFVINGAFCQFEIEEGIEKTVDLYVSGDWIFDGQSLSQQVPSTTSVRAFSDAEVLVMTLGNFHLMTAKSDRFLQFTKIMVQPPARLKLFDGNLTPLQKYIWIQTNRPEVLHIFPLKMIASYLKITPETLSRIRATP